MAVVLIKNKVTPADLAKAKEDYGEYVKVVVDLETGMLTIGGQWHADGEEILLEVGSKQSNLWGGGVDLKTGKIDYTAMINIRADINPSHVVMSADIRDKMDSIIKTKLNL